LLTTIAALSVLPENHGKYIRLLLLASHALTPFNRNGHAADRQQLHQFLKTTYPHHYLEDPPTNLFTDLVTFHGGDYLIFPGITEGGSSVLTHLIRVLFLHPEADFPKQFLTNCQHAILFALSVSDLVAKRLGYQRYQPGADVESELFVPDVDILASAKAAVSISQQEMQQLLDARHIASAVIDKFTCTPAEFAANTSEEENYLWAKPIVRLDDNFIVAAPFTLSDALSEFIWEQAQKWDCAPVLNEAYQTGLWRQLQISLRRMDFRSEQVEQLKFKGADKRGFYKFDEDKIAYIELVYNANSRTSRRLNTFGSPNYEPAVIENSKAKDTLELIRNLPQYAGFQFLHIALLSLDGSDFQLLLNKIDGVPTLTVPTHEFDVLNTQSDIDAIDLWKFAQAQQEVNEHGGGMPFVSFLDMFKLYRQHNDSFYVSDESRPDFIVAEPGHASDWFAEAQQRNDYHSTLVLADEKTIGQIPVLRRDKYSPIYCNVDEILASRLRLLVNGFSQPVWVEPASMPAMPGTELRSWFYEMTDAIAYWLWQMQPGLAPLLNHSQLPVIRVTFECQPLAEFATVALDFTRVSNLAEFFQISATSNTAHVVVPSQLLPYLYGANNEGERELARQLLLSLSSLLQANNLPVIDSATIEQLVDTYAPLGMKKKLLILHSGDDLRIDPRHLVSERLIQDYDTSRILDAIGPELKQQGLLPPVGELTDLKARTDLTYNIVMAVLLPKLSKLLAQYEPQALLCKLLELNETFIRSQEKLRIDTPARIACFVGETQQVQDLAEKRAKANQTSIAIRCLIEHLAAEQLPGTRQASLTDIDELIALMGQIMTWGALGDQLKSSLSDVPMGILPTDRIGTDKAWSREVLAPYFAAKIQEDVTDAVSSYQHVFPQHLPQPKHREIPEFLDKAFTSDFGVSLSRLGIFLGALVDIVLMRDSSSVVSMPQAVLFTEVNKLDCAFGEEEFLAAINFLSLTKRGNVADVPDGHEGFDVAPWRFNRRLSLLRKPLVAIENTQDLANPVLYWGFRQLIVSHSYLGNQIQTNRLRVPKKGEVEKALGQVAGNNGNPLVRQIAARLEGPDRLVKQEVKMKSLGVPKNIDLGDVDVLVIDSSSKLIYSLECKALAPSRSVKEMAEEMEKLLDPKKGLIQKHVKRHEWLIDHLPEMAELYQLDLTGYRLISCMVTAEAMLLPFLKEQSLPLDFITRYEIEKGGFDALPK
jgi:hypothetical protein